MTDVSAIEEQYRKILYVDWSTEDVFLNEIPIEAVPFWVGIASYSSSKDEKPFLQLAIYALSCLTTPISNAVSERMFSQVTCVKTKLRNRMQNEMLDSIIRIRSSLKFKDACCKDFCVSNEMIEFFNS